MQPSDLAANTSAALVVTTTVGDFPEQFAALLQTEPHMNQHRLLVHNADKKTISIDLIRELKQTTVYSVGEHERQEIIILWAELLSVPAQHAVLKLLEEPPAGIRLWLVTDQPQSLLETIRSRCVQITVTDSSDNQRNAVELTTAAEVPKSLRTIKLEDILNASYTTLIGLAGMPKDRIEAAHWCNSLLQLCRLNSVTKTYKLQQALVLALERLQQNGNVKLVLEACLFQMKASV